jgi:hypothetical protein
MAAMAITRRRNLSLEFDPDSKPIAGSMRDEGGRSRTFAGWLGLAAVLGGFLRDPNGADRPRPGSDRRSGEE